MTADVALDLHDDASLHDLAVIHHLLALKVAKKNGRSATESAEGSSPSNWLKQDTCIATSCGMEGHVCGTGHCLNTLSEQHRQLAESEVLRSVKQLSNRRAPGYQNKNVELIN